MRSLGDLYHDGEDAEKAFVAVLLVNLANGKPVTNDTWRVAEELWEGFVSDMLDLGRPKPESAAMYALSVAVSAGTDWQSVLQRSYAPPPT